MWQGCIAGGVHGREGHAWQGDITAAGGTYPTGMHSS